MRKYTVGVGENVSRNGRPVGLGLACWPREWKPDEGREIGVARDVGVGFHFNVGHLIKGAIHDVGGVAKFAGTAITKPGQALKDVEKVAGSALKDVAKVEKIAKFVLEQAQGLISLIPGIGTAISVAIGAGLAALEGGSALDIAIKIAYAAIPIPPGIKVFTDLVLGAVLDVVNAVVKGGDLAKVLERVIAEELSRALPDDVRASGTTVLTTLTPTVLQALTGKLPSIPAGLPALPAVPGLPAAIPSVSSIASALPAGLPAVPTLPTPSIPGIPGVTGVGDKVDDFEAQLKSQYAAMNLPDNVKRSTDPIFNALVSMVHSMSVGPAILLAVRTGIGSKLPAGAPRDVGLHIFDTLAHLILGKLFKGKPTQAQVASQPTPAQLTAIRRANALGAPLPGTVTPVPSTAAAYQPLAQAEKANSTDVTISVPSAIGVTAVYGPYPQQASGSAPAKTAALTPPPVPPAPGSAPPATMPPTMPPAATAGTTAGVGGGGHGGGGGRGGGGGGHPGGRGGYGALRPNHPRGSAYGWGGRGGWGGGAWWPYVVASADDVACAAFGAPIDFPAELSAAVRRTLSDSNWMPVVVRGSDGSLYRLSLDDYSRRITVRPCVSMGVGSADDDVLRAMALDLLAEIKRTGAPEGATRSVKNFAQAFNQASADAQIATDGKYTQEIAAALNAALSALSPASGSAPAAIL